MTIEQHLAWLLYLMEEHPEGWKQHCWHRAKELAAERPELADLPRLLAEAVASLQPQSSSSSDKPGEQPGTDGPEGSPAPIPMTRRPGSTGQRPMSLQEG